MTNRPPDRQWTGEAGVAAITVWELSHCGGSPRVRHPATAGADFTRNLSATASQSE